ncbi:MULTISPECIES: Mo-dependent nitrogenase C-terminal domain-containing protein [unclassified Microcoleus]|uniref:Mo-dependent nitrogenase C-terminal domain-containing protein n=1 Tax=unclassified Microcoleus TaxID=2642155 RepID=UPI002FD3F415
MYSATNFAPQAPAFDCSHKFAFLDPLRQKLDAVEVNHPQLANWLCQIIPAQCPFARNVKIFDKTIFRIPPLCKLNPFYEQLIGLRFRALTFLADTCKQDISKYC